jgi:hypothetical protein
MTEESPVCYKAGITKLSQSNEIGLKKTLFGRKFRGIIGRNCRSTVCNENVMEISDENESFCL